MAETVHLEVVTPGGAVVSEDVECVIVPGYEGEFGVYPNHAPLLSAVRIGVLSYRKNGQTENLMVSGGFCEVSGNHATFLAESAERGREIDAERALRAKERAEKRLSEAAGREEKINRVRAEAALQRALARIKVAARRQK